MSFSPMIKLNDGREMPQLGFGLWQVPDDVAEQVTLEAFKVGYRSIDSAQIYRNEAGLGRAIQKSGLPRNEMFITTKVWNTEQGYDKTMASMDVSLKKLGLDYVDLLLIHWPAPKQNLYVETWKALIALKEKGLAKSIGVSNFTVSTLNEIIDKTGVKPVLNQIELHPRFNQKDMRAEHHKLGIATECWSPLGQGQLLQDPAIVAMAKKYNKTPAQVLIRWHLDNGFIVIPKSVTPSRIAENFQVFDFKLNAEDLQKLQSMDSDDGRIGPNPDTANF